MKYSIKILFFILITGISYPQWISNYGGSSTTDINLTNAKGYALDIDGSENCYVTGVCNEGVTGNDIVIIKYDPNGDTIWVRSYNGSGNSDDAGYGISVDASGNIYVVGTSFNTGTSGDITLLKYDSTGILLWSNNYYLNNGNSEDAGLDIKLDNSGYIYITGYGTANNSKTLVVTQKYSPAGELLWTKTENGPSGNSRGIELAIDNSGNVCVTGFVSSANTTDAVLVKYNSSGDLVFKEITGGEGEDKAWSITVDDEDNIFIAGYKTNSENNTDCYIAKFDSSGSLSWERTYNGTGGGEDKAWAILADDEGDSYITGSSTDWTNNVNYVTIKYDASGDLVWSSFYNGTGSGSDISNAIGLLYVEGNVSKVITAGQSWGTNNNYDFAVVQYDASTGSESSVTRYSLNEQTDDRPQDIAVSSVNARIYITGYSEIIIESQNGNSSISTLMYHSGNQGTVSSENNIPKGFELRQNYPNPFNPSTTIQFSVPKAEIVKLTIYDVLGKTIDVPLNKQLNPGTYSVTYINKELASGIYIYELTAGSFRSVKKMSLIK